MTRRRRVTAKETMENEIIDEALPVQEEVELELPSEPPVVEEAAPVALEPVEQKPSVKELIFLSEEDKRLLKKYNSRLIDRLGIKPNRSVRIVK